MIMTPLYLYMFFLGFIFYSLIIQLILFAKYFYELEKEGRDLLLFESLPSCAVIICTYLALAPFGLIALPAGFFIGGDIYFFLFLLQKTKKY